MKKNCSEEPFTQGLKALFVALMVAAWFLTQSLLGSRGAPKEITDNIHLWLAPATEWLGSHRGAADALLIVTSGLIDLLGCFLLARGVIGPSVQPLLGLTGLYVLRQLCQFLALLPPPQGMIWRHPGVPSLFVTYGTPNDFFFSGHTAIAVYGAIELARLRRRWLTSLGILIAAIEALTVLALRVHYTMDVFTAILAAAWASNFAIRVAPRCDLALASIRSSRPGQSERGKNDPVKSSQPVVS